MSSAFNLENGVAIPVISGRGRKRKYPLEAMTVGQSFSVHVDSMTNLRAAVSNFKKSNEGLDKDFTVRNMGDGTARVWRTK